MVRKVVGPELLTPAEVAHLWRVDAKTVSRWAREGKLRSIRTLSMGNGLGHRRFYAAQVQAMLAGKPLSEAELDALTGVSHEA